MNARKNAIDPAVADLLGSLDRQSAQRAQPVAARKRQAKERQKLAKRNRVTFDLPEALAADLEAIAAAHECPISQVAAIMLQRGINDYNSDRLNLAAYRTPSRSPRYTYTLVYEDKTDDH